MAVVEGPILEERAREQGGSVREVGNGTEDQGIGGGGRFDVTSESEVECLDDHQLGDDGGVDIIGGGVNGVSMGEGVGRGHLGTGKNLPDDIEVLKEKGPAGLSSR